MIEKRVGAWNQNPRVNAEELNVVPKPGTGIVLMKTFCTAVSMDVPKSTVRLHS